MAAATRNRPADRPRTVVAAAAVLAAVLGGCTTRTSPAPAPAAGAPLASHHVHRTSGDLTSGVGGVHLHGIAPIEVRAAGPVTATRLPVAADPVAISRTADGVVWIAHRSGIVTRYARAASPLQIPVGGTPSGILATPTGIWVTDQERDAVLVLDPVDGSRTGMVRVPTGPVALTVAAGRIWVTSITDGFVTSIDPRTLEAGPSVPTGFGPIAVAASDTRLFVVNALDRSVSSWRIDGDRLVRPRIIAVRAGASDALIAHGSLWVACSTDGSVLEIDPVGGRLLRRIALDPDAAPGLGPAAIAADAAGVVVANNRDRSVRWIGRNQTAASEPRYFGEVTNATPVSQDLVVDGDGVIAIDHAASLIARITRP